ncbi:MAG: TerC family protein [Acidobacteria bacterium]|nr:TerC family protein [Acidobacteriota bacterium]MDW7984150.1 TerC family protein [Acidobacteriota bacterium]
MMTEAWIALATLTAMEVVLGIDNIVFISIVSSRLPQRQQSFARRLGLLVALVTRLALLFTLTWIMGLTKPLFVLPGLEVPISGRNLILLLGGLFLIAKSTYEIHDKLEGAAGARPASRVGSFAGVLVQIALIDIIFSLDSVITAVGMARQLWVMVTAIVLAIGVMLLSAEAVHRFIERHPTVKMLALSFLLLIGVMLVAEGLGRHIERGYIYFAMGFSLFVEVLNLRLRAAAEPVHLRGPALPARTVQE